MEVAAGGDARSPGVSATLEGSGDAWWFLDSRGLPSGPFARPQMREWLREGHLSALAALATRKEGPFAKLAVFFPRLEEAFEPGVRPMDPSAGQGPGGSKERTSCTPVPADSWFYKDETDGKVHGPFPAAKMNDWARMGKLGDNWIVSRKPGSDGSFTKWRMLFPDVDAAFLPVGVVVGSPRPSSASASKSFDEENLEQFQQHRSASATSTTTVKTKLFGRGSKHRRSNSAGMADAALNEYAGLQSVDSHSPASSGGRKSPSRDLGHVTTNATSGMRKFTGKKLLSVVTTPKYGSSKSHKMSFPTRSANHRSKDDSDAVSTQSRKLINFSKYSQKRLLRLKNKRLKRARKRRENHSLSNKQYRDSGMPPDLKTSEGVQMMNGGEAPGLSISTSEEHDFADDDESDELEIDEMDFDIEDDDDEDEVSENGTVDDDDDDEGEDALDIEEHGAARLPFNSDFGGVQSFRFASMKSEPSSFQTFPIGNDEDNAVTDHVYALLDSFRSRYQSGTLQDSSASSFVMGHSANSLDPYVDDLRLEVAELQDENSRLRAYVRNVRALLNDSNPKLLSELPDPLRENLSSVRKAVSSSSAVRPSTLGAPLQRSQSVVIGLESSVSSPPSLSRSNSTIEQPDPDELLWEDFVVVEFDEDSPMLRRKVSAFEEGIEELRGEIKDLLKSSFAYLDTSRVETSFARVFAGDLNQSEIRKLSPLMKMFHQMLMQVTQLREGTLDSLEKNLVQSFEEFLKNDIKNAQILRRNVQRERDHFETLESKYMHHRRTKHRTIGNVGRTHDAVENQMLAEMQDAKAAFELARFKLIRQINQLETKKQFVLVDRTAACIDDLMTYFRNGFKVMASYAKDVENARTNISGMQEKFDLIVEKWNQKQKQLEAQLSSGSFPKESKERRRQNMSKPQEKVLVHSRTIRSSHDPLALHEGYLYKKSSSVRKDWKRRWFVLRTDKLLYYRGWKDPKPQPVCDIMLCTVREVKNSELKCCFEIISPNKRAYVLQAVNEIEMHTWMEAIRRAIEISLAKQSHRPSLTRSSGMSDPDVQMLMSFNATCADCDSPNPEWVSLNLGVVICIACSGIHRSLGTHISKVRSIALDQVPRSQLQLIRRLGNATMNGIFEARLSVQKPQGGTDADLGSREDYIRRKYVKKEFALQEPLAEISSFFEFCRMDDIEFLAKHLFLGFPLGSRAPSPLDGAEGSTAIHVAAAAGAVECVELLALNGANIFVQNSNGDSPEDVARKFDREQVLAVLKRIETHTGSDSSSKPGHRPTNSAPTSPLLP